MVLKEGGGRGWRAKRDGVTPIVDLKNTEKLKQAD